MTYFRLNTGNGGATAGDDYTSIPNRDVNIPTSANVISLTIPIREDGKLENDEIFTVTVTSQSAPHLITATPAITVVTITDNDGTNNYATCNYIAECLV